MDELSAIKCNHVKKMEIEIEQTDEFLAILRSFDVFCTELRSNAFVGDICSSAEELILRADELEKDHEAFIGRTRQSFLVSFQATDSALYNPNCNVVGNLKGKTKIINYEFSFSFIVQT